MKANAVVFEMCGFRVEVSHDNYDKAIEMSGKVRALVRSEGIPVVMDTGQNPTAVVLDLGPSPIAVIKAVRVAIQHTAAFGSGLREAKDYVDQYRGMCPRNLMPIKGVNTEELIEAMRKGGATIS